jgi:hypothetical protein
MASAMFARASSSGAETRDAVFITPAEIITYRTTGVNEDAKRPSVGAIGLNAVAFDLEAVLGEEADRLGIGETLLLEDAGGERIRRVIVLDETGSLDDDRSGVVLIRTEMDGAAADFAACGQDRFVDVVTP